MIVYTTGTACAGTPTVVHGGMTYNTVQIGTQCWLRENMNIGTRIDVTSAQTNNPTIEKYCYNNDPNNCNVYGGLYQWAEMVQYLSGVTNTTHWNPLPVGNVQGICPAGWHIPTDAERLTLVTAMGGNTLAGGAMKEIGLAHWGPLYNVGATNQYGFTALPGGYAGNGSSYFIRENATFWTTEKGTLANAAQFFGASSADDWIVGGENFKTTGLSVRCLKD
jgi:uncharacterized protein (TIGR02145 family)